MDKSNILIDMTTYRLMFPTMSFEASSGTAVVIPFGSDESGIVDLFLCDLRK